MTDVNFGRVWQRFIFAGAAVILLVPATFGANAANASDCRGYAQKGIDWSGCKKSMLIITGSELDGANLTRADLSFTDFRGSSLKAANLEKSRLVRASFALANLEDANLNRIEGYRISFINATINRATFAGAEVQRADFREARLQSADFTKAELGRADFRKADITNSRFTMANLARARLTGSLFTGALDFHNAFMLLTRIEGVDLSAATGLEQAQIDLACGDAATRLPPGLTTPSNWPCADDPDDSNSPD